MKFCMIGLEQVIQAVGKSLTKVGVLCMEKTIYIVAENMAEAIREWNRAKVERESWKPVAGQMPPVGILGNAKKANIMLAEALKDYEAFKDSIQRIGCTCPLIDDHTMGIDPLCVVHGKLANR